MKKVVLGLLAVVFFAAVSQAQVIKLSLWDRICIPGEDYTGGLEIAIGTQTQKVEGVQFAFIYSQSDDLTGVQFGLVNNAEKGLGVQWGFVNLAGDFTGAQLGALNWAKSSMTGIQWGFVNYAKSVEGLQLGFVNYTESMKGIQLGFINIIKNNPAFLPVFVFFNFCF